MVFLEESNRKQLSSGAEVVTSSSYAKLYIAKSGCILCESQAKCSYSKYLRLIISRCLMCIYLRIWIGSAWRGLASGGCTRMSIIYVSPRFFKKIICYCFSLSIIDCHPFITVITITFTIITSHDSIHNDYVPRYNCSLTNHVLLIYNIISKLSKTLFSKVSPFRPSYIYASKSLLQ